MTEYAKARQSKKSTFRTGILAKTPQQPLLGKWEKLEEEDWSEWKENWRQFITGWKVHERT
ncbi:MAG: hypothetical protein O4859_28120 [Trichodesmium sp. St18_bin1]|nr:hypothetical protein [Trichodesmium sp. St18_bin1]MDE5121553.1 hypothetical protein [Trichodesmium sp. St19_bin1]